MYDISLEGIELLHLLLTTKCLLLLFTYVLNNSLNETYGQSTDTWICIDLLLSIKYILFYSIP